MDDRVLIVSNPTSIMKRVHRLVIRFDEPCPAIMADGIAGTSLSHHWLEGPPGSLPYDDGPAPPRAVPQRKSPRRAR